MSMQVLTRRLIRFFEDQAKNDREKFLEFYIEYHMFLKEGICQYVLLYHEYIHAFANISYIYVTTILIN